jgi:hypothetical protein
VEDTNFVSCFSGCHLILLMTFSIALLTHDNDLLLHKTLIILSCDLCDSPCITVIQNTECILHGFVCFYSIYLYFQQPCWHNFLRGYSMVVSFVFIAVSKRDTAKQRSLSLIYCTSWGKLKHWILVFWWMTHQNLLGTHCANRRCWQCYGRSAVKHCQDFMMLILLRFTSGFSHDFGWLTLDAKWLV